MNKISSGGVNSISHQQNPITRFNWLTYWKSLASKDYNVFLSCSDLIPHCLWNIWLVRNNNLFNLKKNPIHPDIAINLATEYKLLITDKASDNSSRQPVEVRWEPPLESMYKLNTDGSVGHMLRHGGLGVIRNRKGTWILGYYQHLPYTNSILDEVLTLSKGLILSKQHNSKPLLINTGCKAIIHMLTTDHPLYCNILAECRSMLIELEQLNNCTCLENKTKLQTCLLEKERRQQMLM